MVSDGFLLNKGSKISEKLSQACPPRAVLDRNNNKDFINENFVTLEPISFPSVSAAAAFVVGYSINGNNAWKTKSGKTINEVEKSLSK